MNDLLAGHAHRGFFARVAVDDAAFFVAVQIEPATHIIGLDKIFRHGRLADQRLHTADDAFAGDTRFEQHLIHEVRELFRPAPWRDLNAHCLGEIMNAEDDVFDGRVLHQIRRDFQRLRMLNDRLNGDAMVQPDEDGREITDFRRAISLARFGKHHRVDVVG